NHRQLTAMLGPETRVIASVKGCAYGLGVVEIAKRLVKCGVHGLTTGSFDDAVSIRQAGLDTEIVMFGGTLPEGIPSYLGYNLVPTVHNMDLAEAVSRGTHG